MNSIVDLLERLWLYNRYADFSDCFDDLEPSFWEYYYGGPEDEEEWE